MRIAILGMLFFCASVQAQESGRPLTDEERKALIAQLERSRGLFLDATRGVTAAQAGFKPGPERWSVLECAEHLALTEPFLFGFSQSLLKSPVQPVKDAAELQTADQKVLQRIVDRSQKAQAPEPARPTGKFPDLAAAVNAFGERRVKTIEYVKATQDDLRNHTFSMGGQAMDAYQMLLMLSAHTERHTLQIKEVQASAGYPK